MKLLDISSVKWLSYAIYGHGNCHNKLNLFVARPQEFTSITRLGVSSPYCLLKKLYETVCSIIIVYSSAILACGNLFLILAFMTIMIIKNVNTVSIGIVFLLESYSFTVLFFLSHSISTLRLRAFVALLG